MPLIPQRHRPPKRPPLPPFSIVFHPQRPTVQQRHPQRTLHNRLFGQIRKPFVAWVAGDAAVGGVHDEPSGVWVGEVVEGALAEILFGGDRGEGVVDGAARGGREDDHGPCEFTVELWRAVDV